MENPSLWKIYNKSKAENEVNKYYLGSPSFMVARLFKLPSPPIEAMCEVLILAKKYNDIEAIEKLRSRIADETLKNYEEMQKQKDCLDDKLKDESDAQQV